MPEAHTQPASLCLIIPDYQNSLALEHYACLLIKSAINAQHNISLLFESTSQKYKAISTLAKQNKLTQINLYSEKIKHGVSLNILSHFEPHYRVYQFLKQNTFQQVICFEQKGLLFYACLAKKMGLEFEHTQLTTFTFRPSLAGLLPSNDFTPKILHLGLGYTERKSVEYASHCISSNTAINDWMERGGYNLNNVTLHHCNQLRTDTTPNQPTTLSKITEIVFFLENTPFHLIKVYLITLSRYQAQFNQQYAIKFILNPASSYKNIISDHIEKETLSCELISYPSIAQFTSQLSSSSLVVLYDPLLNNSGIASLLNQYNVPHISPSQNPNLAPIRQNQFKPYPHSLFECIQNYDTKNDRELLEQAKTIDLSILSKNSQHKQSGSTPPKSPLVSVCVTHHERPDFLIRALHSIRAQTYQNIEVIVIDDGSINTDTQHAWQDIQKQFDYPDWRFITHQNQWLGAARNHAASLCKGEYLVFFDDDNIMKPEMVEIYVSALRHSHSDILTCFNAVFYEDNFSEYPDNTPPTHNICIPIGGCAALGLFDNIFGDASCIVKKEVFDDLGGYWESYSIPKEDHDFFCRAVSQGYTLEVVPEPLYFYRKAADSMMGTNSSNANFNYSANAIIANSLDLNNNSAISKHEESALKLLCVSQWHKTNHRSFVPRRIVHTLRKLRVLISKYIPSSTKKKIKQLLQ